VCLQTNSRHLGAFFCGWATPAFAAGHAVLLLESNSKGWERCLGERVGGRGEGVFEGGAEGRAGEEGGRKEGRKRERACERACACMWVMCIPMVLSSMLTSTRSPQAFRSGGVRYRGLIYVCMYKYIYIRT
jgi:hypothetical protein